MTYSEWREVIWLLLQSQEFWIPFITWWPAAGIAAAAIFHDFVIDEVSPWGSKDGRYAFWLLVGWGYLGLIVSLYSCYSVRRVHTKIAPIKPKKVVQEKPWQPPDMAFA